MTDGELHKRLELLIAISAKVNPDAMRKWINAAKREWIEMSLVCETVDGYNQSSKVWFKKWFGDADE